MYAELGLVHLFRKQFDGMESKDLPTWNALIAGNDIGYTQNGKYRDALGMYLEMEKDPGRCTSLMRLVGTEIYVLGIPCSWDWLSMHAARMVAWSAKCREIFKSMEEFPNHSKTGTLWMQNDQENCKKRDLSLSMPMRPDSLIWVEVLWLVASVAMWSSAKRRQRHF
ncbi:OLC1v1004018C1 [Oldenlandia corymbosa var. corymbosa]|uniref:OLC1v1004018C1 n=1 Tax=Oldenlandia corymbosa var. corymbosa TaxID=529605 RepID=A0AAV1DBZ4_OLDCO|nr:OLC1v1004018C1 [Oldenlandia corymbosa var. corymbosa]